MDWNQWFDDLKKRSPAPLPRLGASTYDRGHTVIRELFVDLSALQVKLRELGYQPRITEVYADVVRLPGTRWIVDGGALLIAARRVEVDDGARVLLDYRTRADARLVVYAGKLVGDLPVVAAVPEGEPVRLGVGPLASPGAQIRWTDGRPVRQALRSLDADMLARGSDFARSLAATFAFATLLLESEPDIAGEMLRWVASSAAGSPALRELFMEASAMVTLAPAQGGAAVVPALSRDLYIKEATTFIAAAQAYERQYLRFCDRSLALRDRVDATKLMLGNYADAGAFNDELIKQAEKNLDAAKDAVDRCSDNLNRQQFALKMACKLFEVELEKWQRDQLLAAVGTIVVSLATFAVTIGAAVATGGAAAPAAGISAMATFAAIGKLGTQEVAAVVQVTHRLAADTQESAKSLKGAMEALKKGAQILKACYALAAQLWAVGAKLAKQSAQASQAANALAKQVAGSELPPAAAQAEAEAAWARFQLDAACFFGKVLEAKVPGAAECKLEVDRLVTHGRSLAAAQASAIAAGQDLVRLWTQRAHNKHSRQRIQEHVEALDRRADAEVEAGRIFYEHYMEIKRTLFVALANYRAAHRYWAIGESSAAPSLFKSVAELREDLARTQRDHATVLRGFDPPPQRLRELTVVLAEPAVLDRMRKDRSLTLTLDLAAPELLHLDRVRLSTVRVWLDGARPGRGSEVRIELRNSGAYLDRRAGVGHRFTARPLVRGFRYQGDKIVLDGAVADEHRFDYFEPTPFSEWTFTVQSDDTDLAGLTRVRLEFAGSAITSSNTNL